MTSITFRVNRPKESSVTCRKWEDVYLMQYDTPKALRIGIDKYIRYYTEERSHSSLEGATPSSVYYSNNLTPKAA